MNYEIKNLKIEELQETLNLVKRVFDEFEAPYYSQEGVEYYIPKQDFEEVIQTFLTVESEVLESNAIYNAETKTYLYRPRGLYDYGSTYEPYPEVVSYEKMDDGKIKLIINAVWERTMQDNAMTSELVIQPLDNNRFHYISNQVIKSNLDDTSKWYRNRLTYGEWNKIYKENDEIKYLENETTIVGYLPFVNVGDTLKIVGKIVEHQEYGKQVKVDTFEKMMPQTTKALERYLANCGIKGIGPATASKIVDTFGEDTLNVFKFEPEKLAQIKGITKDKAIEIANTFIENWEVWQLVGFLDKFGIGPQSAEKIYKKYNC